MVLPTQEQQAVDIDLALEGSATKVSRQQVSSQMLGEKFLMDCTCRRGFADPGLHVFCVLLKKNTGAGVHG